MRELAVEFHGKLQSDLLSKWIPGLDTKRAWFTSIIIWVRIFHLPVDQWDELVEYNCCSNQLVQLRMLDSIAWSKGKLVLKVRALVDLDIITLLCAVTIRSGDQCRCYPFQIWRHILLLWCVLLDESSSQTLYRKWSFSHPNGGVNSSCIKGQELRKSTRKQRRRNGDWKQ